LSGIGRIGAGYVLDKIDYRIVLATVSAMMAASFAYLQLVTITSVSMTLPFILLFGIGFGSVIPMRGTLGSMMFGTKSLGSIVGLLQGGSVAAGVVGPIFMGIIFDINGNYDIAIWAMILVSALMVPMAFVMSSVRILDARISTLSPR
jgi:cyanate permease